MKFNKYVVSGTLLLLLVLVGLVASQFSIIDEKSIANPTLQGCEAEAKDFVTQFSDDVRYDCGNCYARTRSTTSTVPPALDYWGWGTYSYVNNGQYYYKDGSRIEQESVRYYGDLSSLTTGKYTVEWLTTCERTEYEDKQARSVCSEGSSSSDVVGIDGSSYFNSKDFSGADVYYMSDLDKFYGELKDTCRSDEVCHQDGLDAYCTGACEEDVTYYCSLSRVIRDDGCGDKTVVDTCSGDSRCVTGESECVVDEPTFIDDETSEDFEDTGSDEETFEPNTIPPTYDEPVKPVKDAWYTRFWDWIKEVFTI